MGSFVGYIRVSRIGDRGGDSFQAPRQQREQIEGWARAYGHEIAEIVTELDVSGGRAVKDRELERLVRLVEAGEADGIIVARLDRFARSLLHGLAAIERIEKAGGTFVAVQDGFDLSTPAGRFTMRTMLAMAEFELDRIRLTFRASKEDAVRRGLTVSSVAAFGYRRPGKGRHLEVVEDEARWVRLMFERRAAGVGWAQIAHELEAAGVRTRYGSDTWANRAVRAIVRNRVYLGEARLVVDKRTNEELVTRDAHPAIVTEEMWRQANQITGPAFTPRSSKDTGERSIVRGLLRCSGCRGSMRWDLRKFAAGEDWLMTCRNRMGGDTSRSCSEPASIRQVGDVEQWIIDAVLEVTDRDAVDARGSQLGAAAQDARDALVRAIAARDEWRDDVDLQAAVGMGQYVEGLRVRQQAVEVAEQDAAAAEVPAQLRAFHGGLRTEWPRLSGEQRARVLESLLLCVMVRGKRHESGGSIDGRLQLVWRGEPVELPTRGRRSNQTLGPFVFDGDRDANAGVPVGVQAS